MHVVSALPVTVTGAAELSTGDEVDVRAPDYEDAFKQLFLAAFRAAYRILGDRHAAEDVAADALTAAHLDWLRIGSLPYRDAWVIRVATNRALDSLRRRRAPIAGDDRVDLFDDGATTRVAVARALRKLPRRQREVVVLRMLVGLPVEDVASVLRIGTGSVRTHLGRGVKRLRSQLHLDLFEEETCE